MPAPDQVHGPAPGSRRAPRGTPRPARRPQQGDHKCPVVARRRGAFHAHQSRHLPLPRGCGNDHQHAGRDRGRHGGGLEPPQHPGAAVATRCAAQHEAVEQRSDDDADAVADRRVDPADQTLRTATPAAAATASATGRRTVRRTRRRRSRGGPGPTPSPAAVPHGPRPRRRTVRAVSTGLHQIA